MNPLVDTLSVLELWANAREKGVAVPYGRTPEPDDIVVVKRYDKNGKQVGGHTGVVQEVRADGKIVIVAGNNNKDQVGEQIIDPYSAKYLGYIDMSQVEERLV